MTDLILSCPILSCLALSCLAFASRIVTVNVITPTGWNPRQRDWRKLLLTPCLALSYHVLSSWTVS